MPDSHAVIARGVRKRYGTTVALDGIDLTVDHGEVFGLLGPHGAGKTTFCEILEGHRSRDEGEVEVLGYDPADGRQEFKDRIGVVLQEAGHPPTMTVIEAVRVFSAAYPHPRQPEEVLELVGLSEKVKARVKTLSGGKRRRLDLALGIAGDPDLIFLDEPTTGFDPSARRRSWELVANLRNPFTRGSGFAPHELLVVAIWGIAATVFAARRFRWEPAPGKPEKGRRALAHTRA